MSITVQLELPKSIAQKAKTAGLLGPRRLGELLSEELRRERARKEFGRMLKKLHSLPGKPMSREEIQAEVDAVRAGKRRRASRR